MKSKHTLKLMRICGLVLSTENGSKMGRFKISRFGKISLKIKKGHELILQFKTFAENISGHSIGEPKPK